MEEKDLVLLLKELGLSIEQYNIACKFGYEYAQIKALVEAVGLEGFLQALEAEKKSTLEECFVGERFKHYKLVEWIIKHCYIVRVYDNALPEEKAVLHIHENGKYNASTKYIESVISALLPELKTSQRKEVIASLELNRTIKTVHKSAPEYIPFKSYIYDIANDRFLQYTQDFITFNRLPYDYKKNAAPQPNIDNFLDAVSDGDEEIKQLLLEAFGSCFFTENRYRGSFWLVGEGRNGKSTALNMLSQMLGRANISNLSAQAMQNRFRTGELYEKLANIGDDIPSEYITDDSILKLAITGEALTSETKHDANLFPFVPYAKFFFAMNSLPRIDDRSAGLYSRVKIIPFEHDFTKDDNTTLKNRRWTDAEMEYLVKLSIEAFKGVIQRNGFCEPQKVRAALEEYKEINNPVLAFFNDVYESNKEEVDGIPVAGVYQHYQEWCLKNGYNKPYSLIVFGKAFRAETGLSAKIRNIHGDRQKVYTIN